MSEPQVHIEDWKISYNPVTREFYLTGEVSGHPKIPDETTVRTSKVVHLEAGKVETANSIYLLGKQSKN